MDVSVLEWYPFWSKGNQRLCNLIQTHWFGPSKAETSESASFLLLGVHHFRDQWQSLKPVGHLHFSGFIIGRVWERCPGKGDGVATGRFEFGSPSEGGQVPV